MAEVSGTPFSTSLPIDSILCPNADGLSETREQVRFLVANPKQDETPKPWEKIHTRNWVPSARSKHPGDKYKSQNYYETDESKVKLHEQKVRHWNESRLFALNAQEQQKEHYLKWRADKQRAHFKEVRQKNEMRRIRPSSGLMSAHSLPAGFEVPLSPVSLAASATPTPGRTPASASQQGGLSPAEGQSAERTSSARQRAVSPFFKMEDYLAERDRLPPCKPISQRGMKQSVNSLVREHAQKAEVDELDLFDLRLESHVDGYDSFKSPDER
eukprot:CAMPEP_0197844886 /NCGR_PEP_ID=MMETSP1438-20131217/1858_1 /TAXON_ID=1461541 /ORGANISM="Pterosperma sp., Strain CCMP1384" /LENGTH=270 /DNA_ID=CAMNT_0043455909 /DNA_START=179 /DNA_END=991 /DNA_ORIENTATION=-